jgi:cobalt/nickel transport system permease protein
MKNNIPSFLLITGKSPFTSSSVSRAEFSFLDKTILNSAKTVKSVYDQAENAAKSNFIQKLNPNVKLISLIYIIIVISVVSSLTAQLLASAMIFSFFLLARLRVFQVYRKIFFLAFIFGFLVVLPASLNVITPGKIIFNLISLNKPSHFLIYSIPQNIGFTESGFHVVLLVFLRVLNSVSFSLLIVFTTPFPAFIKSFKISGVPDTFLMIIMLAYKYIYILSRTIEETYFALKSRFFGNVKRSTTRKLIGGRIFFIFKRSVIIYENTFCAMVSRGYNGEIKLYSRYKFTIMDFASLVIIVLTGIVILFF